MTAEVAENVPRDGKPPEAVQAEDAVAQAAALTAMRLEKIQEYLRHSLGKVDPLEANLGAVSADLMQMALRLKEAIEADLGARQLDHFEKLMPAIDAYLRVTRQIDRLASLDRRLTSPQSQNTASKPR